MCIRWCGEIGGVLRYIRPVVQIIIICIKQVLIQIRSLLPYTAPSFCTPFIVLLLNPQTLRSVPICSTPPSKHVLFTGCCSVCKEGFCVPNVHEVCRQAYLSIITEMNPFIITVSLDEPVLLPQLLLRQYWFCSLFSKSTIHTRLLSHSRQ